MACVFSVSEFQLGSSWSSYASLGVCMRFLASVRVCFSVCLLFCANALVQHVFCLREWVDAGSLAGHICDHRLVLTLKL